MARSEGLGTEVQYLKGVGPKNAMLLKQLGVTTVGDMLWRFPRRYEDRRNLPPIRDLSPGEQATIRGRVTDVHSRPTKTRKSLVSAVVSDGTGTVTLVWFNQPWIAKQLRELDSEILAYGAVKEDKRKLVMSAPEWEAIDPEDDSEEFARLTPVYSLTAEVPQRAVRRAARSAVEYFLDQVADPLPEWFRRQHKLNALRWCIRQMHLPDNEDALNVARRRLVFEDFLYLQLALHMKRMQVKQEAGIAFNIDGIGARPIEPTDLFGAEQPLAEGETIWDEIHRMVPFELTSAQRRVVGEIFGDMRLPTPMNRLVQGDVGSGKTAVAAAAMLAAVRCGYQAVLMAPTEILAEQHSFNLRRLFQPMGIHVTVLVGKLGARERAKAYEAAATGLAQICVGTTALVQEGVKFRKLGLVVVDEQHRFGVLQRAALRQKGLGNPDVLVMTATPIPRTLSMTLYGDLDVSIIDELPPGRKPIKTHWKQPTDRPQVYEAVRQLIDQGRQAYFVCPMITESEKMQTQAAEDLFYRLSKETYPDLKVGLLHGQMKPVEKEETMERFRRGETQVLVSTVVIEVGVDVPNATVMVIEDANRFGLSQLHQLRGRVGRGQQQSFCILVAGATTDDAEKRLAIMRETTDGFRIAEEDLKIRGPGDLMGTQQSGLIRFRVADLVRDSGVLEVARQAAIALLAEHPELEGDDLAGVREGVKQQRSLEAVVTVS